MEFLPNNPINQVVALFLFFLVSISVTNLGSIFLNFIMLDKGSSLNIKEKLLLNFSLGISLLAIIVFFFGFISQLKLLPVIFIMFILMAFPLIFHTDTRVFYLSLFQWIRAVNYKTPVFYLFLLVIGISFLYSLTPPIGNDSLVYHLAHAKVFITQANIDPIVGSRESLWPYQQSMLYCLGLLLEGTTLAKLFHWAFYPVTGFAIYVIGLKWWSKKYSAIASWCYLLTPAIFSQSGYAYTDLTLGFYLLMAIFPFLLASKIGINKAAILSGAFCGGALATKYLALGAFGILILLWFFYSKYNLRAVILFIGLVVVVSGIWYLRSWFYTGNPVYPFFHEIFGGNGVPSNVGKDVGMGKGVFQFFLLPWNMVMYPDSFGGPKLGPIFLVLLPVLLIQTKSIFKNKEIFVITLFGILFSIFLFTQSQQVRFFLSIYPLACLGIGSAWKYLDGYSKLTSKSLFIFMLFISLLHLLIFSYKTQDTVFYVTSSYDNQSYLESRERSFKGHRFLNQNLGTDQKVFIDTENRRFYSNSSNTVYKNGIFRHELKKEGRSVPQYLEQNKFDYLWLNAQLSPEIKSYLRGAPYKEVYQYKFIEEPAHYEYKIYKRLS